MELLNMDPDVVEELYKVASINLSPNSPGQVRLYLPIRLFILSCCILSVCFRSFMLDSRRRLSSSTYYDLG